MAQPVHGSGIEEAGGRHSLRSKQQGRMGDGHKLVESKAAKGSTGHAFDPDGTGNDEHALASEPQERKEPM